MNRTVLLLNVIVLVVTFVLALTATNSQIGILHTTQEVSNVRAPRQVPRGDGSAVAFLRVVQSLETAGGGGPRLFTPESLRALHEAMATYRGTIERGVSDLILRATEGEALKAAYDELGRLARQEVELTLASHFGDPTVVKRLTTEIVRNCG